MGKKIQKLGWDDIMRLSRKCTSYEEFRAEWWAKQDLRNVNLGSGTRDGKPLKKGDIILQPKRNSFLKDLWLTPSSSDAKYVARVLLDYDSVVGLELKMRYVYVKYMYEGDQPYDHTLPGQDKDGRSRVTG